MKSINSALLHAFHAVAAQGSFTRAARSMRLTQPTLSQQVKLLEESFGVLLLERSGRGVRPTELGASLFDITRRMVAAEQEAAELLTGVRTVTSGILAVGGDGPFHVVPLIQAFQQAHPGPEVTLSVGNSAAMLAGLMSTALDIVVVAERPDDPMLYALELRRDPVMAMLPAGHPMAKARSVRLADLVSEKLILREKGSVTRMLVEASLQEAGLVAASVMEIESREAVREAVAAGIGIGFVSRAESPPDPRLKLLPIAGHRIESAEYVVCLQERRRLAILRAFLQVAEKLSQAHP